MKNLLTFIILFTAGSLVAQVKPNEDFSKNIPKQNKVDSISVFRPVIKNYDLVTTDKIPGIDLEIASRGAEIDVISSAIIENFKYHGETENIDAIKFKDGKAQNESGVKAYMYHDSNTKAKSWFYRFSDQPGLLYRKVSRKKKSDIIIYHISKK